MDILLNCILIYTFTYVMCIKSAVVLWFDGSFSIYFIFLFWIFYQLLFYIKIVLSEIIIKLTIRLKKFNLVGVKNKSMGKFYELLQLFTIRYIQLIVDKYHNVVYTIFVTECTNCTLLLSAGRKNPSTCITKPNLPKQNKTLLWFTRPSIIIILFRRIFVSLLIVCILY